MMRFLLKIGTLSQAYQTMLPVFISKRVPLPCASQIRMVLHYAEGPGTFFVSVYANIVLYKCIYTVLLQGANSSWRLTVYI